MVRICRYINLTVRFLADFLLEEQWDASCCLSYVSKICSKHKLQIIILEEHYDCQNMVDSTYPGNGFLLNLILIFLSSLHLLLLLLVSAGWVLLNFKRNRFLYANSFELPFLDLVLKPIPWGYDDPKLPF